MAPKVEFQPYYPDPNRGFDKEATPPWLLVGKGKEVVMKLMNPKGTHVRSRNPFIAKVKDLESMSRDDSRVIGIEGRSVGRTHIEVFASGSTPIARLEVQVKDSLECPISFRFVTDHTSLQTTKSPNSLFTSNMLNTLGITYSAQANVDFPLISEGRVRVDTSLPRIVNEQQSRSLDDVNTQGHEWKKLVSATDPQAVINVFIMPWYGPEDRRPARLFGKDGICVCDDGMADSDIEVALPHMIGRLLGAEPIYNDSQEHHLMYHSRVTGVEMLSGSSFQNRVGFIPKNVANALNPF